MLHLNQIRKKRNLSQLEELAEPQSYAAASIYDFLAERQEVQTTGLLSACLNGNPFLYDNALITFRFVRYWRISEDTVRLEDTTGPLQVGLILPRWWGQEIEQQGISNGDKVQQAIIRYQRQKDQSYLYKIQKSADIPKPSFVPVRLYTFVPRTH